MATCAYCKRDMLKVDRCTRNERIVYPSGTSLPTIPYPTTAEGPCGDCGVQPGQKHHPGCDMEECPKCHGQLISCGCFEADGMSTEELLPLYAESRPQQG